MGNLVTELSSAPGVGVDSTGEIYLGYNHGFQDGDVVTYSSGGDYVIGGLIDGDSYFVNVVSDSDNSGDLTIRLARSKAEALEQSPTRFAPGAVSGGVNSQTIELGYVHHFQLGDAVAYHNGGGVSIGGLEDGQTYYVIPVSSTAVALTRNLSDVLNTFDTVFDPAYAVKDGNLVFR